MGSLDHFNLIDWLEVVLIFIVSITIHEFAHAFTADRLGDNTPRAQGRVSLNPIDHLDPLGTVLMAVSAATGFGIGWGKPVQYNPANLKSPRWDPLKVAVAGPVSNILQALVFAALIRLSDRFQWWDPTAAWPYQLVQTGVLVNVTLALFNMIPIPPLDGSKVISALLPTGQARRYDLVMAQIGIFLFFVIAFTGITNYIIGPPVASASNALVGWPVWQAH